MAGKPDLFSAKLRDIVLWGRRGAPPQPDDVPIFIINRMITNREPSIALTIRRHAPKYSSAANNEGLFFLFPVRGDFTFTPRQGQTRRITETTCPFLAFTASRFRPP